LGTNGKPAVTYQIAAWYAGESVQYWSKTGNRSRG